MPRHFLSLADLTPDELHELLNLSAQIKANPAAWREACRGQSLAMVFQKPSLRTRVSFEVGIFQLGGHALYLGPKDIQLHRGESISDTARVLSRFVDGIMARVFGHDDLLQLAASSSVPVINGLSDLLHPVQVLADLLTMVEKLGELKGRKLAYIGDGNNMTHSLLYGGALMGMDVAVAHPAGYGPNASVVARAREIALGTGAKIEIGPDPMAAAEGADAVYTDTWASMGQEDEREERIAQFNGYQVDVRLMSAAKPSAIFLHCLPAHRGEEVTDEVIEGPQSVIFDEAENRLYVQKAIMVRLMGRQM